MQRFRIEYAKQNALRYTGNLDMQKVWERFLRRADLPVSYSQGFHPQPKIQQACPLPLGLFSEAEIVDIWLNDDLITAAEIQQRLTTTGQPGILIKSVCSIELFSPALQSIMLSSVYFIDINESVSIEKLPEYVAAILSTSSLTRERRGKTYNLRPLIEEMVFLPEESSHPARLSMRLAAREGATGRPDEVLAELGVNPNRVKITRIALNYSMPADSRE